MARIVCRPSWQWPAWIRHGAWIRQSEVGIYRCIFSFAIDYVGVSGAGCVGAGLVGEDGRLEIKCQGVGRSSHDKKGPSATEHAPSNLYKN